MKILKLIFSSLTGFERKLFALFFIILIVSLGSKIVLIINKKSDYVPVRGGYYREGIVGQPTAINPIISDNLIDQSLSSLIYANVSDLKSSLEIKNEGKIYALNLKEGLKWSDGKSLTSDDIIFTIKTIQDPEIRSPFYKTWKGVVVERISELQIEFTLPGPYVYFKNNINNLPVIPKHIFEGIPTSNIRLSSYNLEPVSSGPYKFENFSKKRNGFITEYHFSVNDDFADKKPYIKDFYFKFYKNETDLLNNFRKREIDGFSVSSLPDERLEKLSKTVIEKIFIPRYYAVFFNPKSTSILKNAKFREALSISIDREKLVNEILNGEAESFYSLSSFVKDKEVLMPNKEKAKEIIKEIKESQEEDLIIEIVIPDVSFIKKTADFIKSEWESINIDKVEIVSLKDNDFQEAVIRERNYEAIIFGNVLKNELDLFPFWHSSERFYPGFNFSFYSNKQVDTALENIRNAETREKREEEFLKAVLEIENEHPAIFVYTLPCTYIHHERLYGFKVEGTISSLSDRFKNVSDWYITRARVIKDENNSTPTIASSTAIN
jgi:peptide/nickel transport system substrate-binding protein